MGTSALSLTSPFQANLNSPWAAALNPEWGRQVQKARGTLATPCLEEARPRVVALQPLIARKWNLYMKIRRGAALSRLIHESYAQQVNLLGQLGLKEETVWVALSVSFKVHSQVYSTFCLSTPNSQSCLTKTRVFQQAFIPL